MTEREQEMAITPADIEQLTFSEAKKSGYATDEVDAFLEQLTVEVDMMLRKIDELKNRLSGTEQQLAQSQNQVAMLQEQLGSSQAQLQAAQAKAAAPQQPSSGASERQISLALIQAQQTADKMVDDARDSAEKIRNDADQKAREVIRQALAEKQAELDEIDRLKASREEFRAEYKKLLQHFMDDMEATFPNQSFTAPSQNYSQPAAPAQPAPMPQPMQADPYAPAGNDFSGFGDLD